MKTGQHLKFGLLEAVYIKKAGLDYNLFVLTQNIYTENYGINYIINPNIKITKRNFRYWEPHVVVAGNSSPLYKNLNVE